jgi:uncharacterized membrane protein
MDQIILLILLILGVPLAAGIWLIARAISARNQIEELARSVDELQVELAKLKRSAAATPQTAAEKIANFVAATLPARKGEEVSAPPSVMSAEVPPAVSVFQSDISSVAQPQPATPPTIQRAGSETGAPVSQALSATPPPIHKSQSVAPARVPPLAAAKPALPKINWEQFMGVKGFAWLGGVALFLGIAFFIKYSFDNNLVPPQLRVAIGFLAGLGLLAGGMVLSRKNFAALSQTLCATGVVVLYAVTFACRALYHFEFFGPLPTFLLLVLITVAAFLLAVRLEALVVAVLGMLGGFLTPVLLSTGQDNPLGLFGYIAILDAGLVFVALSRRWHFLTALAALGTAIMQTGWADKFFTSEKYFEGDKILIALAVLLGFNALYLAANWLARRRTQSNKWLAGGSLGLAAVALGFTLYFFDFAPLAQRPVLLFSFVFLIDLTVAALAWLDEKMAGAQAAAGLAVFGLLAFWTAQHLTSPLLNAALVFYLIFALFHSALPVWQRRRRGVASGAAAHLNHCFPPLALLLVLVPIFKLQELSFLVWPFILLVDLLAIVLAALTATLLPVLAVLLLTLAATGALIFKIPSDLTGLPASFFLLGAFAVFFVLASGWLARKFQPDIFKSGLSFAGDVNAPEAMAGLLPASSAVLPFLLLIMASLRLPLADPSPVFGLALLLVVLLLGLARMFALSWMPLVGLISTFAVECAWHFSRFDPANPMLIAPAKLLAWYVIFFAVFQAFPFIFLRKLADQTFPWAAAALGGPAQFLLIFRLVKFAWPNSIMGLLPAAFAVPALVSLVAVLKAVPPENKARLTQLAWFGGVALFFITLIVPVQFDRQWITIGWALEGAALLWLFHRVPHPGLRLTGVGLLLAAFVRLAFNPAVLAYHPRSATPVFNWYLYTYGLTTVALFLGASLLAPPRQLVLKSNAQAVLGSLGTVLAFLLLNIEIADFFSAPGSTLTFQFSGNFARDMTYSIAWALFALGLLVRGIAQRIPSVRYAAMALLCATLVKLFFHDLAQLGQLYRIGAFVGVAVVAMLASFAYQKFYSAAAKPPVNQDENKT